jgi:hypothetical protein
MRSPMSPQICAGGRLAMRRNSLTSMMRRILPG